MLVPVCAEVEAEPEAEFPAVDNVVIVALVSTDGAEEVLVAVATATLVVVFVDTPLAVAVVMPVVAICVPVVSEVERAPVEGGVEDATVS